MDMSKSDSERVHYLEQQRGLAFAADLMDVIEERVKEAIDEQNEEQ
jgi:hypothetical protein